MKNLALALATACVVVWLPATARAQFWSDNFDSYTPGPLVPQSTWEYWNPGNPHDAFVVTQPVLSAPHSVEIAIGTDVVHPFNLTSGRWEMTTWNYVPTEATGYQWLILCNTFPVTSASHRSLHLVFSSDHNLVVDVMWDSTGATLPLVRGQWTEVEVEVDLDLDILTVYYNNQLLFTDTWTTHFYRYPPPGALRLQVVNLYSSTGTPIYWDDLVLDVGTVTAISDAPPGAQASTWGAIKAQYR